MDSAVLQKYLDTAVEASREAGELLINGLDRAKKIEYKGRINIVTDMDNASQDIIIKIIQHNFPDHSFLAEEENEYNTRNAKHLWVIDPLDGTTNYTHGYRCFCISIALLIEDESVVGVIYDPWGKELFTALKGYGAYVNGRRIAVSEETDLEKSLLATGFPYDIREGSISNLGLFNHLIVRAQAIRRDGSAALDLAYVAAGRFDGFWEFKLHPWDLAAGLLIVKEAGGTVSTFSGNSFNVLTETDMLATNGKIHQPLIRAIKEVPKALW